MYEVAFGIGLTASSRKEALPHCYHNPLTGPAASFYNATPCSKQEPCRDSTQPHPTHGSGQGWAPPTPCPIPPLCVRVFLRPSTFANLCTRPRSSASRAGASIIMVLTAAGSSSTLQRCSHPQEGGLPRMDARPALGSDAPGLGADFV